ncbi:MAG: iron-containing redox enzyme family protein, partial [Myxococcales bacterium]
MNGFAGELVARLAPKHLLNHPFYQAWSAGELTQEQLASYARQYYHQVLAFPRYVSGVHAACTDLEERQKLLENLIAEERGERNHPELWLRFAEGLGATREQVKGEALLPETEEMIET